MSAIVQEHMFSLQKYDIFQPTVVLVVYVFECFLKLHPSKYVGKNRDFLLPEDYRILP